MSTNNTEKNSEVLPYSTDIEIGKDDVAYKAGRERIQQKSGRGDSARTISNIFMGYNHRMAPLYVPKNQDSVGYTFFTRPDLNLNEANVNASRRIREMLRGGYGSQVAAIIAMLDPLNEMTALTKSSIALGSALKSGIGFDNKQAFIPLLSSTLVSLSGFPDSTLDVYTSEEGLKREQWSMVDSTYQINYAFSLSASFRNIEGDPITTLFAIWLEYMAGVKDGTFIPRYRNLVQREIDYQTRIYRIITDPTRKWVRKIGIANACFPLNDSLGAIMNVPGNAPFVTNNDQLDIQFQCNIAQYLDPILIQEFNDVVSMFNPGMYPLDEDDTVFVPKDGDLVRLSDAELPYFNYYGYPHIDQNTYEISWHVSSDDYERIMNKVK